MNLYVFDKVANIVGKGVKCWLSAFLRFRQCFQKPPLKCRVKNQDFGVQSQCKVSERMKGFEASNLTHYQTTNFRLFQTESLQTTISNLTKNERKLSKRVENTVGKGEIARYEQFLLFPQCFQKACFPGASKGIFVWECVKEDGVSMKDDGQCRIELYQT